MNANLTMPAERQLVLHCSLTANPPATVGAFADLQVDLKNDRRAVDSEGV